MSSVKLIKINKTLKNKKNLYKEILSSSAKIKDIIRKKKVHFSETKTEEPSIKCNISKINNIEEFKSYRIEKENEKENENNTKPLQKIIPYIPPKKKTKKNEATFFKPTYKEKYRSNNIKQYFKKNIIQIRIFTKNEILKFITVLNIYSTKDQYKTIHKYIRKLNKYQVVQILYALKIIKNKSNAPENLLKNLLYSYFTSYITIIKY